MKAETAVLDIQGQYRVYTEFYRADCAERTIILVNCGFHAIRTLSPR